MHVEWQTQYKRYMNQTFWGPKLKVFSTFWRRNLLRAKTARTFFDMSISKKVLRCCGIFSIWTSKCASCHSGVQFFMSHLTRWLCRRFSEPTSWASGATKRWENTVFCDFFAFSHTITFFLLTLSLLWFSLFFLSLLCLFHVCFSIRAYCRKFDFKTFFDQRNWAFWGLWLWIKLAMSPSLKPYPKWLQVGPSCAILQPSWAEIGANWVQVGLKLWPCWPRLQPSRANVAAVSDWKCLRVMLGPATFASPVHFFGGLSRANMAPAAVRVGFDRIFGSMRSRWRCEAPFESEGAIFFSKLDRKIGLMLLGKIWSFPSMRCSATLERGKLDTR